MEQAISIKKATASPDFSKWAVVGLNDDTGLGRMACDVRSVLGFGQHVVIPSERLQTRPLLSPRDVILDRKAERAVIKNAIEGLEGLLILERHDWVPDLLKIAREKGVRTVCVPMWEWFRGHLSEWRDCDLFACPNKFCVQIVQSYGFRNAVYLPWALDLEKLPKRSIAGPARHFVHNAGLVDADDRKGTRDTIKAFAKVKRTDLRLTVRMQKEAELPKHDERVQIEIGNQESLADLYSVGDAAIQPSKMEGLGFMVLEPVCSGIPVITTNYPPMNEWVQQPELRCNLRWFKRKAFATQWVKHAHLRLPSIDDLARRIEWCADNDLRGISQGNRFWAERIFSRDSLLNHWRSVIKEFFKL
ncbi:MAG: glycosyltransferase [Verrucomicrobiota bacterium]|nr:glycosyltransferase [Verrucomicrobiota bacterium]